MDGKSIGRIGQGTKKEIELAPGEHNLNLKMRWYQRREHKFTLFNKETKSFVIQTNYQLLSIHICMLAAIQWLITHWKNAHIQGYRDAIIFFLVAWISAIFFSRTRFVIIKEEVLK